MTMKSSLLAVVFAAVAVVPSAYAAEDFVKPAPTPAPTAGPTLAAAAEFCGDPSAKAPELFTRYSTQKGLKEVYKSIDYVAYSDDEKNSAVMYTFTVAGHPAHPAAVCRKIVKEAENLVVKMFVVCEGEQEACGKLQNDFNVMTAKMQLEVNDKVNAKAGK